MLHNAKTMVKALLARDKYTKLLHLTRLKSGREYIRDFEHTQKLLLACKNPRYVNQEDKKEMRANGGNLERSHLSYILNIDTELH